eukprot:1862708-Pleurochrysis_carterae.AAC.1
MPSVFEANPRTRPATCVSRRRSWRLWTSESLRSRSAPLSWRVTLCTQKMPGHPTTVIGVKRLNTAAASTLTRRLE